MIISLAMRFKMLLLLITIPKCGPAATGQSQFGQAVAFRGCREPEKAFSVTELDRKQEASGLGDDFYDAKVKLLPEEIRHYVHEQEMPANGMLACVTP